MEVELRPLFRQGVRRLLVVGLGLTSLGGGLLLGALLLGGIPTGRASLAGLEIAALQPLFAWTTEWAAAAVLLLLLGGLLFSLGLGRDSPGHAQSMQLSADAEGSEAHTTIRVSAQSMKALVAHVAMAHPAVREARPKIRLAKDGWQVDVDLELWAGQPAVSTAAAVRQALLEILPRDTGLPVARLDLLLVRERAGRNRRRVA